MTNAPLLQVTRRSTIRLWTVVGGLAVVASGCRGDTSAEAPIHINPNMDDQAYLEAQEPSAFFADGRGMRPQVAGTVAVGALANDTPRGTGKKDGQFVHALPRKPDKAMLERGKARFGIYCAPCHGLTGEGKHAILMKRGMTVPPPSYLEDRILAMPVGQIYDIIRNGVRNMPAYGAQIPISDRWAIAAYVRVLQIAGSAKLADVPASVAHEKGWR